MKVSGVSGVGRVAQIMESPVVERLNSVRRGLKKHGAVVLQDNPVDAEVLRRLQKTTDVNVERSKNIKVSVK